MKNLTLIFIGFLLVTSCANERKPIVSLEEITPFLQHNTNTPLQKCDDEIAFWKERKEGVTSLLKIAGLYSTRFKVSGNVDDVHTSDSLFNVVATKYNEHTPSVYHMLAANSITQHEFKRARTYLTKAYDIGDSRHATQLMLVDVDLELGDIDLARMMLKDISNKNSFAYLIRESKLKDKEGDLDSAIVIMEKAFDRIKDNHFLYCWAKSNLADMYGHAGRVEEAYRAYLDVLEKDPDYDHALKGIAWVAFSHDRNFDLATTIIRHLNAVKPLPDYNLLLARIAAEQGDDLKQTDYLAQFISETSAPKYGYMYAKYQALLNADVLADPAKTVSIAEQEIRNRPCPQSYDLLGWGYYNIGDADKALAVMKENVEGQTAEPEALYHLGVIYKANKMNRKAKYYLEEALKSSFELGPAIETSIRRELSKMS